QVNRFSPEPLERVLYRLLDVCGPTIQATLASEIEAEFGGDRHLVTNGGEGFAHQFFVGERAVDLRGVEESHAALDGRADEGDRLLRIGGRAEAVAQSHTAEAEGRDLETTSSKCSLLHAIAPVMASDRLNHGFFWCPTILPSPDRDGRRRRFACCPALQ